MTGCAMIEEFDRIITGRGIASLDEYLTRLRLRPTSCIGLRGGVCGLRSSLQGQPWL